MPATAKQVIDLLGAMVRIESVTPWLIPTGSGCWSYSVCRYSAGDMKP